MRFLLLLFFIVTATGCSHVFYQPSPKHYLNPTQFKLQYEDIYFASKDGTKLNGWFFPAKAVKPKGTIVQFHGNAENISTHFMSLIWIINEGYNLFIFDYRGYAKSEGTPTQAGVYQDALAAMEKGRELHLKAGGGKFVIYGQSLGGIISLRAVPDFKYYDDISLIVQDSTFSSYKGIAFDRIKSVWFLIPFSPLGYVLVSNEYASYKVFDRITKPTLVIAGQKDMTIPAKFGKEIYKGIKSQQKWWWSLPNGEHISAYHHDGNIYRQKFVDLLDGLSQ